MTKNDTDFETWFDNLANHVLDRTGADFRDTDSVRDEYEAGRDMFDVADDISAAYLS